MNQNSNDTQTFQNTVQHSKPIPISTQHLRHRSTSFSSDLSNSPPSPPIVTPKNFPTTRIPISSTSPVLYFLSQSPSKTASTFPFRGLAPPVIEDDPAEEPKPPAHARSASTTGRFQPQQPTVPELHHERGVNVLRRLSLGGHLGKPPAADIPQQDNPHPPPNSAVSNPSIPNYTLSNRKTRRSATINGPARPRRVPSPMGERILKGHFDGFN